jgi:hypothetical protein
MSIPYSVDGSSMLSVINTIAAILRSNSLGLFKIILDMRFDDL